MTTFHDAGRYPSGEEFRERRGHAPSAGEATGSNGDLGEDWTLGALTVTQVG